MHGTRHAGRQGYPCGVSRVKVRRRRLKYWNRLREQQGRRWMSRVRRGKSLQGLNAVDEIEKNGAEQAFKNQTNSSRKRQRYEKGLVEDYGEWSAEGRKPEAWQPGLGQSKPIREPRELSGEAASGGGDEGMSRWPSFEDLHARFLQHENVQQIYAGFQRSYAEAKSEGEFSVKTWKTTHLDLLMSGENFQRVSGIGRICGRHFELDRSGFRARPTSTLVRKFLARFLEQIAESGDDTSD